MGVDDPVLITKAVHIHDHEHIRELIGLVSAATLTGLDAIDRMDWLEDDSKIQDLG